MEAQLELETHYGQVRALYALTREAVQRYGGTLQPFAGDQIMALFVVPLAQEAHAQLNWRPCTTWRPRWRRTTGR